MSITKGKIEPARHNGPPPGQPERRNASRCRFMRMTLSTKFILLMATLLSAALVAESVLNYRHQKALLLQSLQEKASVQGKFVSEISKEAILGSDYESLNRYMEEISRIEDIAYSAIFSPGGQNLTSYLDRTKRAIKPVHNRQPRADFSAVLKALEQDPAILTSKHPIQLGSMHIADFVIGVDTQRIEGLVRAELQRQLLSHAALILTLGVVIYFAFRSSMLSRIRALIEGAARVSKGILDQPIKPRTNDELCDLTHSFNRMMDQLRESNDRTVTAMDELRDLNRNLESRVQERTARLELALRIAQMGHWDYDISTHSLHLSPQVCALFNLPVDKPARRTALLRAIHPDDRRDVWQNIVQTIRKNQSLELEFRVGNGDSTRTLFASAERLMDEAGKHIRLFGIAQDITARVLAEYAAHTAFRETLEAKSASEAKSAFLANMSHEIRTPLTAIIGFAESLREPAQPESERQDAVATIIDSGKHLLQVINEILDMSKIESRRLTVELLPTRVAELVNDVESVASMLAEAKNLTLTVNYDFPAPALIQTDPTRLKQVLLNLCGNAIKFTSTGGVRIRVYHLAEADLLCFDIADSGIGIPADKLPNLFTPFVQADTSTTRRFGGTGLGLYISKQLAEMLGGGIEIKSTEGLGTLATVSVATGDIDAGELLLGPQDVARIEPRTATHDEMPRLTGTVLLAEDNPINQRLIVRHIQRTGAQVETAENGQIAFEKAHNHPYELILMDMQMPLLDGLSATRKLREAGYSGPIVALTANAFREDRENCRDAGCNDFLTKPIDLPEFHRVLGAFLPPAVIEAAPEAVMSDFDREMRDLVERFVNGLPEWVEKIQGARAAGNFGELRSMAHQLKGLGGSFGYPDISQYASELENLLKRERAKEIAAPFASLCAACDAAVSRFNRVNA